MMVILGGGLRLEEYVDHYDAVLTAWTRCHHLLDTSSVG